MVVYPTEGYEDSYRDYPEDHPIRSENRNLIALSEYHYDENIDDRMFAMALTKTHKLLREYRKASMCPEVYGLSKFYAVEDKLYESYGVLLAYLDSVMIDKGLTLKDLDKAVEPVLKRRKIKLSNPPAEESEVSSSQQEL